MAPPPDPRLRRFELAGVVLLLLAAAVPRVRDLGASFDRAIDGFQGSCFALFAVNYERVGIGTYGGYPVFNVDLPNDSTTLPYVYANHPPLAPLLGWASVKLFGPSGWNEAWREARAPRGIEGALRFPFLALHLFGLWALWWAVRQSDGARRALLALALAAMLPIGILCAGLVNYENACIPLLTMALGFHVRWLARDERRDLWLCGLFALLASLVTFTPLLFVPALALHTLFARGWRKALLQTGLLGAATLVPLLAHGLWVRLWVPSAAPSVWIRAQVLLEPLFDGTMPFGEWCRRQVVRLSFFCTPWILAAAGTGLLIQAARSLGRHGEAEDPPVRRVSIALPLALGAFLSQLVFYTHTFDGDGAQNGQTNFLLNLAPAVAVLAAIFFDAIARPLWRLRGGFGPLVLSVALFGLPAVQRAGAIRREWREPGPRDDPFLTEGPAMPLPATSGARIAEVLPPGDVGLFPSGAVLGPAASFYAWRTLLGVDEKVWGLRMATIDQSLGLPDAERYLLFPRDPVPAARELVERFRPGLLERFGKPLASNAHWERWPPEP